MASDRKQMENKIMAHRYLYYVLASPVISDRDYDAMEERGRSVLPPESPVHSVGSDLRGSYTDEVVKIAESLLR